MRPGRGPAAATAAGRRELLEVVAEHPGELARPCGRTPPGRPRSSAGRAASRPRPAPRPAPRSRRPGRCGTRRCAAPPRARRGAAPRVAAIGIRWPSPNGPPVQPVLTSQTVACGCAVELLAEHPRVHRRLLRQERRAEAGRERRLRLGDADLRAGDLRRVAGEEVEHRLVAGQPRDRRQDPEGVGGEHDHRARVAGLLGRQRVRRSARACRRRACSRSSSRRRGRARRSRRRRRSRGSSRTCASSCRSPARPRRRGGSPSRSSRPRC